jgi:deoxyribodipyrimidine photo-lyase
MIGLAVREIESVCMLAPLHVVWYKRDLRLADHAPLTEAAARGPVLPLYIIEPSLLRAPDFDPCHWTFIRASLMELRARLAALGQPLVVRVGEAVEVLERLAQAAPVAALWAHEETGSLLTYRRDRAIIRWARERGLPFHEMPQTGVVRRLAQSGPVGRAVSRSHERAAGPATSPADAFTRCRPWLHPGTCGAGAGGGRARARSRGVSGLQMRC